MNFKHELKTWYKQFKALYKDGLILNPSPLILNDTQYNLSRLSPFMYTLYVILSGMYEVQPKMIEYYSRRIPFDSSCDYIKNRITPMIENNLNTVGKIAIIRLMPNYQYVVARDEKGYLFLNEYHGPIRMSLKNFIRNACFEIRENYYRQNHPMVNFQVIIFQTVPLETSISNFLRQHEVDSDEDEPIELELTSSSLQQSPTEFFSF
jgi:hypothetical protein